MTPTSLFERYVTNTPGKAARMAVAGLKDTALPFERERAAEVAVLLRKAGRCARCGRELSNPSSVAAGVGPECRRQMHEDRGAWREVRAVLQVLRDAGFPTLELDVLDELEPDLPQETP